MNAIAKRNIQINSLSASKRRVPSQSKSIVMMRVRNNNPKVTMRFMNLNRLLRIEICRSISDGQLGSTLRLFSVAHLTHSSLYYALHNSHLMLFLCFIQLYNIYELIGILPLSTQCECILLILHKYMAGIFRSQAFTPQKWLFNQKEMLDYHLKL